MLQWNSIQCVDETFHLASISQVKTNIHNRIRKQHYCNCVFFLCLKCIQWDCMTWGEALMQYSPASMHSINQCLYAIKLLTSRWVQLFHKHVSERFVFQPFCFFFEWATALFVIYPYKFFAKYQMIMKPKRRTIAEMLSNAWMLG